MYLSKLIQELKEKARKIISPREAYTDPIAKHYRPESSEFNKQGRIASILYSQGVPKENLRHKSENKD